MRRFFERSKSNEDETSPFQGKKYSELDQGNESAWDEDYRNHVNPQSVQNEKMRYDKEIDLYDTTEYKNLKAISDNTICFIKSYKKAMINKGIIDEKQYNQVMGSFREKITAFRQQLDNHELLVNDGSPATDDTGRWVSMRYSEMKECANELLDKVMDLAGAQHQEQMAKTGSYQPPEPS